MMNSVQFRRYDRNGLARDRGKPIRATIVTDAHLRFREMMVNKASHTRCSAPGSTYRRYRAKPIVDPAHAPCCCSCRFDGVWSEPVKGGDGIQFCGQHLAECGGAQEASPKVIDLSIARERLRTQQLPHSGARGDTARMMQKGAGQIASVIEAT